MILDAEFSADPELRIPRAEERLCFLQNSAAVANIFIRMAGRKAQALEAGEETEGGQEALDAFVQASRILHVSVALQPRVEKELAALRAGDPLVETTPSRAPRAPREAEAEKPERDRKERRMQIRGHVLELVDPESFEEEECERIYTQLTERIYESDRYDALLDLPLEEAVEAICKDLGVRPQYELWEGLNWPSWRVGKPAPDPSAWPSGAPDLASEPASEPEHDDADFTFATPPWPPP